MMLGQRMGTPKPSRDSQGTRSARQSSYAPSAKSERASLASSRRPRQWRAEEETLPEQSGKPKETKPPRETPAFSIKGRPAGHFAARYRAIRPGGFLMQPGQEQTIADHARASARVGTTSPTHPNEAQYEAHVNYHDGDSLLSDASESKFPEAGREYLWPRVPRVEPTRKKWEPYWGVEHGDPVAFVNGKTLIMRISEPEPPPWEIVRSGFEPPLGTERGFGSIGLGRGFRPVRTLKDRYIRGEWLAWYHEFRDYPKTPPNLGKTPPKTPKEKKEEPDLGGWRIPWYPRWGQPKAVPGILLSRLERRWFNFYSKFLIYPTLEEYKKALAEDAAKKPTAASKDDEASSKDDERQTKGVATRRSVELPKDNTPLAIRYKLGLGRDPLRRRQSPGAGEIPSRSSPAQSIRMKAGASRLNPMSVVKEESGSSSSKETFEERNGGVDLSKLTDYNIFLQAPSPSETQLVSRGNAVHSEVGNEESEDYEAWYPGLTNDSGNEDTEESAPTPNGGALDYRDVNYPVNFDPDLTPHNDKELPISEDVAYAERDPVLYYDPPEAGELPDKGNNNMRPGSETHSDGDHSSL